MQSHAFVLAIALAIAPIPSLTQAASAAPESAVAGIGESLPPLSARDRDRLVARADAGDLSAMYALAQHALREGGPMYFWGGWGDVRETEQWWRKAAALGDPKAMILLGRMYAEPWGVPQDVAEAARWFTKAADAHSLEGIQNLIDLDMGAFSDARDEAGASVWLSEAVAMGDHHALLLTALRYDAGWGVPEDGAKAALWYEKTIAQAGTDDGYDRRTALNNLGALYEQGRGVAKDEHKAAELYGQSDSWHAQYNLAVLCETGRGVVQDKTAALWLYRNVALFDLPEAAAALKRLNFDDRDREHEAGLLLAHDHETRTKTLCDP